MPTSIKLSTKRSDETTVANLGFHAHCVAGMFMLSCRESIPDCRQGWRDVAAALRGHELPVACARTLSPLVQAMTRTQD